MCYTCTYSLCKGCIKDADILCVRGNKGFCTTCMRTVLLVEDNERGNKEMVCLILYFWNVIHSHMKLLLLCLKVRLVSFIMTSHSLGNSQIWFVLTLALVINPGHILMSLSLILETCVSLVQLSAL